LTDDLVNQLRGLINDDDTEMLAWYAADRIEQLEKALREIVAMTPDPEFGTLPIESAIKVARAALGEKHGENAT
jgi:hypothetical protein